MTIKKMKDLTDYLVCQTDNISGSIFLVDSYDRQSMNLVSNALAKILLDKSLKAKALLVLANKQDISNAMTPRQIEQRLNLKSISGRKVEILSCIAKTGDGVFDALEWFRNKRVL